MGSMPPTTCKAAALRPCYFPSVLKPNYGPLFCNNLGWLAALPAPLVPKDPNVHTLSPCTAQRLACSRTQSPHCHYHCW